MAGTGARVGEPCCLLALALICFSCYAQDEPIALTEKSDAPTTAELRALIPKLQPLHEKIHPPGPMDWLKDHPEPGQTFEEYLTCQPETLRGERRIICIQPLGELKGRRREIVELTADFMARYFGTPVRVMKPLSLDVVPEDSRRASRGFGEQLKSTTVLYNILTPRMPKDAAAYIALTDSDLYPEDSWNFVFGQASLRSRVGVWSLARFGDPDESDEAFLLCLLRTIKTATHETGHIFSMRHCTLYECNMNGSNHLAESDAKPLWLCPECFAKVIFATGQSPKENLRQLAAFARKHGMKTEAEFYEKSATKLKE
jgi:archaemetzincin